MTSRAVLPQIETIVVLMLENRSLDTMLGWLHSDGRSINLIPRTSLPSRFDGIGPGDGNSVLGERFAPVRGHEDLGEQRWRVPRQDPAEGLLNVQVQMYGDDTGHMTDTAWGDHPPMTGFAVDYLNMLPAALGEVMGAYTRSELPILYGLAAQFGVSDRWFSSVPTETDPNRCFALCGTSEGKEMDADHPFACTAPTVFNALNASGTPWGIYCQTDFGGFPYVSGRFSYTEMRFAGVRSALSDPKTVGRIGPYSDLLNSLRRGDDIPKFCFIEPAWGFGVGDGEGFLGMQGNDYHPPAWVGPAEDALGELYNALRLSKQWDKMLFVVTFDEHGGSWDHVPPPAAACPDGRIGLRGFPFTRLGPRVPTLLLSPFVAPRTVFRAPLTSTVPFDHTSLLATVLAWAGVDPAFVATMGKRVAAAPLFDHALSPVVVQPAPPLIVIPEHFRTQAPIGPHGLPIDIEDATLQDLREAAAVTHTTSDFIAAIRARRAQ